LRSLNAFLRDEMLYQPVNIFVVRRWERYAGMRRWIFCILPDELERALVRPFSSVRMAIGKAKRARLEVIRGQRIVEGPAPRIRQPIHAPSHRQMPTSLVFAVSAAVVFFFDKHVVQWSACNLKHLPVIAVSTARRQVPLAHRAKGIGNGIASETITWGSPRAPAIVTRAVIGIHILNVFPQRSLLYPSKAV
jgi:hypothetical protein